MIAEALRKRGDAIKSRLFNPLAIKAATANFVASSDPLLGALFGSTAEKLRKQYQNKEEQKQTSDSIGSALNSSDGVDYNSKFEQMGTDDGSIKRLVSLAEKQNTNLNQIKGQTSTLDRNLNQLIRLQKQTANMLAAVEAKDASSGVSPIKTSTSSLAPSKTYERIIASVSKLMTSNINQNLSSKISSITNVAKKSFSNMFNFNKNVSKRSSMLAEGDRFVTKVVNQAGAVDGPSTMNLIQGSNMMTTINKGLDAANEEKASESNFGISLNPLDLLPGRRNKGRVPNPRVPTSKGKIGGALSKLGSAGFKSAIKKIPLIGAVAGLGFGASRLMAGDTTGALLEVGSGLAGTIPGVGTAASLGLDATLAARDAGMLDGLKSSTNIQAASPENMLAQGKIPTTSAINNAIDNKKNLTFSGNTNSDMQNVINTINNFGSQQAQQKIQSASPLIRSNESSFEKMQQSSHWGRRL